jgi:hypothetical protein
MYLIGPGDPFWPWPDDDQEPIRVALWLDQTGDGEPNDPYVWDEVKTPDGIYPNWTFGVPAGGYTPPDLNQAMFVGYTQLVTSQSMPYEGDGLVFDASCDDEDRYWCRIPYYGGWMRWSDYFYAPGDLGIKVCGTAAPAEPDIDINDDYCSVEANRITMTGVCSAGDLFSYTFADIMVVNPDANTNDDPWDGPGNCFISRLEFEATDARCYHSPNNKVIPGSNYTCSGNMATQMEQGEYRRLTIACKVPDNAWYGGGGWHMEKGYHNTGTIKGVTVGPAPYFPPGTEWVATDDVTIITVIVHGPPGTVLPNSFVGRDGENGVTLSWGDFSFGESFNLYRADAAGNFVKLNEEPLPGNSSFVDENVVRGGTYNYKFGIIHEDGSEQLFGPMTARPGLRKTVASLMPSVPNPMKNEASIRYSIPNDTEVSLKVYDMTGALVKTLVNESVTAGEYTVTWNGTNEVGSEVANGVYFYRLSSGDFTQSRKVVVMR